jgi:hypothetical protein
MGVIIKKVYYNDFMAYSSTIEILCLWSMNKDTKQKLLNLGSNIKENMLWAFMFSYLFLNERNNFAHHTLVFWC